jgi:hypothetical protein
MPKELARASDFRYFQTKKIITNNGRKGTYIAKLLNKYVYCYRITKDGYKNTLIF